MFFDSEVLMSIAEFVPCAACSEMFKKAEERLLQLECECDALRNDAYFDHLTGVPGRRALYNEMNRCINKGSKSKRPLSLVLIDLDNFKSTNTTFGHLGGDLLLKQFTEIVTDSCRSGDFFARLGGDEFAIILHDMDEKNALQYAERLRVEIEKTLFLDLLPIARNQEKRRVHATASFGVGERMQDEGVDAFLHRVDIALFNAKSAGGNHVMQV